MKVVPFVTFATREESESVFNLKKAKRRARRSSNLFFRRIWVYMSLVSIGPNTDEKSRMNCYTNLYPPSQQRVLFELSFNGKSSGNP